MNLITGPLAAQLHREVYVAMLNSLLRAPGSKKELAHRADITPVYLSYLLKLDDELSPHPTLRTASPQVAERIAQAVDAPKEVQRSLLEHLLLANERLNSVNRAIRTELPDRRPADLEREVRQVMARATFAATPAEALRNYRAASQVIREILRWLPPERDPLAYVDLCLLLNDSENVLNRPNQALWHAKLARTVLEQVDSADWWAQRERYDFAEINAARAEGVTYHYLHLNHQALQCYARAEHMTAMRQDQRHWQAWLNRDIIIALAELPRFPIRAVEQRYAQILALMGTCADVNYPLSQLLSTTEVARAYLRYGNGAKAGRLLDTQYQGLEHIPVSGPLHRVMFLVVYAEYFWASHDTQGATYFLTMAEGLASQAGLTHQLTQIQDARKKWAIEQN
jgi:hypothetical protein